MIESGLSSLHAGKIGRFFALSLKFLPIAALLACVAGEIAFSPGRAASILSLLAFCYAQSIVFALSSRSRNRSSAVYHFIAVLFSNLVFFWMLERLVRSELSLLLILPYVAGTVAGSVTGGQVSAWIEKKIGAAANIASGPALTRRNFFAQAWPVLVMIGVVVVWLLVHPLHLAAGFAALAGLLFVNDASYAILSRAGNRNKPMFIVGSALLGGLVKFFVYERIVRANVDWRLFVPYVAGGVSGSISGMIASMQIEKRIGASADAHVTAKEAPKFVLWPIAALALVVVAEPFVLRLAAVPLLALFGLAVAQNFSFMIVSRARNRNNVMYHALASVFSNGVWFLTFRQLYEVGLELPFVVPYMAGVACGSLLAYNVSMRIERRVGALTDAPERKAGAS